MTNGEKLNQVFGLPKNARANKCMQVFSDSQIKCLGICSCCKYSLTDWLEKKYKEPKEIEQKITKNFYTIEDAMEYLQEHKISDKDFVSFQKLPLDIYSTIRGCWELVYKDKAYVPAESEAKQ